jgi:hypothetical protein
MLAAVRKVRGILFVDYVRMLRRLKQIDWKQYLPPEDVAQLGATIEPDAWYPMETFERYGNQILQHLAHGQLAMVHLWGRMSATALQVAHPALLAPQDPVETMHRFHVMRQTFFDFNSIEVLLLHDGEAELVIRYYMGMPAEEAATHQTMGFFEGLLDLAGARSIESRLRERSWAGDVRTLVELRWQAPPPVN